MSASALLCLGAGRWQLPFLRACRELGYAVAAADRDPGAAGFACSDVALHASAHDPDAILAALRESPLEPARLAGVFTSASRGCIPAAAELATHLGVRGPGLPLASARLVVDRERFRQRLRAAGLSAPDFRIATDARQIDLPPPLVLKPATGTSGNQGVTLVRDGSALACAIARARCASGAGRVIAEEYIEGRDLGVLALFTEGRARTLDCIERRVREARSFLPERYVCPAPLDAAETAAARQTVERLAACLEIERGPLYVELRMGPGAACTAIEAEPCVPAHVDYLISHARGMAASRNALRCLLDLPLEPAQPCAGAAGCCFAYAPAAGRISKLQNPVAREDGEDVVVCVQPGDRVANASMADLCAAFYSARADVEQVDRRLDVWRAGFDVCVEEP